MAKKKVKKKTLKKHYHDVLDTLHLSRKCIYFAIILFAAFTLIGFIFPIFFVEQIIKMLGQLALEFEGLTVLQAALKIFFNNTLVSFLAIFLGLLIGLFPLMATIQNGYILGFVARFVVMGEGPWALWRILPHGIFELPAIFIAIGLGLKLGEKVLTRKKPVKFLVAALKVFLLVIVPLLVIAAIIEGLLIGLGV
ncbi:hypothetical protein CMI41_02025 [Candidatus Pacearchaeota archaeon]|jgi:stage II sporulation protein M|nr:hypothetical protein [Candidatus Pacearchaeota archaeon]|tara:strand:- start:11994 stop:12578 length:585 start_codon:yes stop_codon:yes gene_type:complete